MRYAPIPPINYIERVTKITKSIFALAQLYELEDYVKALKNSTLDLIVLDNGAYEGEMVDDQRLIEVIQLTTQLQPNAKIYPIVPDEIQNPELTLQRIKQFYEYLNKNEIEFPSNVRPLAVIQVEPNIEKKVALEQMIEFAENAFSIANDLGYTLYGFAIPIWFYRKWGFRGDFGTHFREEYSKVAYLHALGLDDINELETLKPYFNSFDSSMPFTLAYYGYKCEDVKVLDRKVKNELGIGRVPLKVPIQENILHFKNLDYVLKVIE